MKTWPGAVIAILKIIIGIFGSVVIFVAIIYFLLYRGEQQFSEFGSAQSPDGHHILTVNISQPTAPFAPHGIEIVLTDTAGQKGITAKQFHLSNDGANIQSHNIEIRWLNNDIGTICLKGAEQSPVRITVQTRKRKIESSVESC